MSKIKLVLDGVELDVDCFLSSFLVEVPFEVPFVDFGVGDNWMVRFTFIVRFPDGDDIRAIQSFSRRAFRSVDPVMLCEIIMNDLERSVRSLMYPTSMTIGPMALGG